MNVTVAAAPHGEPIEILCLDTSRRIGGGQVSIERLLRHLDPVRFRVTLACPPHSALGQMMTHRGTPVLEWLPTSRSVRIGRVDPLASGVSRRLLLPFAAVVSTLRLAAWARGRSRLVIHANTFQAAMIGAALAWVTGRPMLFHDRIMRSHGAAERWVRSRASRVLAITKAVAGKWGGAPTAKTRLLIDGAEPIAARPSERKATRARLRIDPATPVVLVVARISPEKRIADVIEAVARLRETAVVVVAGEPYLPEDESYARDLVAMAHSLGVRCEFLGFVKDLDPIYDAADVLVLPTLAEAFGQVIIEAMVHGRAIVASRNAGPLEILEEGRTGLLFRPGDTADLSAQLDRLLRYPELREQLGSQARLEVAQRFGIAKTVACFERIIDEVVDSQRDRGSV